MIPTYFDQGMWVAVEPFSHAIDPDRWELASIFRFSFFFFLKRFYSTAV